jgi:hypothetical protein
VRGLLAVGAGITIWIVQMFVGLNELPEGADPWWIRALQALGSLLIVAGIVDRGLARRRVAR